ncbi:hypothetical protein DERF_012522 [Dermatophagoides farinae]|uniref:Uncharacterized protein n=1 Tax=Dermatophagoides farinae TaxID=6954 RepID=A0A922KXI9_DERFA|nr:hypothetical protein DERF_012522 [Dermatophagoides farinae]
MSLNIQKVVNDRIAIIIVIVVDLRKLKRNVSFPYSNHHFHQHHNPDDLLPFAGNGIYNIIVVDVDDGRSAA